MRDTFTINLPRKMPLTGRISEASSQLKAWLQSPDILFNNGRDKLRMTTWELDEREYRYHYLITRGTGS